MYIIELFFKLKEKIKNKELFNKKVKSFEETDFTDEKCVHIFLPVDSTNTVAACVKCGFLIHCNPEDFKKKNIFEDNSGEDFKP